MHWEQRESMVRVAFTLRIDTEERAALENLSRIERRPVNQLLNEAIRSFLLRHTPKERSLEKSLEQLRAYQESDPQFHRARKAFIEAEASVDDPLEGQLVNRRVEPIGPVQRKIRKILSA
jgi:predicted transcriptional regulator